MNAIHDDEEQRIQMQQSALAFLRRNQCEHHGNDQLLFSRTVQYMTEAFDIPLCIAEKLVGHAYGDLKDLNDRRRLDVTASSGNLAVITDPASGLTWAVPVGVIVERIIESADNRRLRLVRL